MPKTLLALLLLPALASAGDRWPEFRGPAADGHSDEKNLPLRWDEKTNIRWKTKIHGKGWSSPVIWGKQIWMTTAPPDGKELFAVCVDRDSGKILHDIKVFSIAKPAFCHPFNSYASPTPALEEGRVYVHFGSAGTACLDSASGKVLWTRQDLPCDHFRGPGSSPILFGDLLILTFDGFDENYLVALNKKDGKTVWKAERNIKPDQPDGDWRKAYSTPAIIKLQDRQLLVSPGAMTTIALDVATGKEIWRVKHGGMNAASRPIFFEGKAIFTTGYNRGKSLVAVRIDGRGEVTSSHVAWTYDRGVPTRPSPLLVGDLLFLVSDQGFATCLEAKTGQETSKDKVRLGGKFSASPLYAAGRIYCCDEDGTTVVLEASKEMKILARNRLDDGCMASPAAAGGALFLRTRTHLYRIEGK